VFCDVDPRTHNIDPEQVEQLITPLTTAILGVHVWGRACNVERLADIAARHGLRLIFDAAHAFACTYHGMQIGGFGDAEVFSFHATKYLNTFEGGAITTNDDVLATKLRRMRNFGFAGSEGVIDLGTNAKMSEVAGLMGVTSLESLDDFIETNRHNHAAYSEGLQDVPGIELMNYDERESNNHQYVVADIDAHISGIDRDILHRTLRAENILTQRYFCPACHQMEPYQSRFPTAGETLPETEALSRRLMQLPTGTAVAPAQIRAVCEMIRFSAAHGAAITDRIGKEGSLLP
jgi:dTDP-4-amino-4,6-dideoxygalactose transaminase